MYDLGDIWTVGIQIKDATGTLANAGAVTCTITLPDTTTASATVTNPTTGNYTLTYTTTQSGRHAVLAQATGANAGVQYDEFDVRPAASTALMSLADARASLSFVSTVQDEQLRVYIDTATDLIEAKCGPILPRTKTENVSGYSCLSLKTTPVLSVTSITAVQTGSVVVALTDVFLDGNSGIIERISRFGFNGDLYTVVYVAGRSSVVDEHFRQAARQIIGNLWSMDQRGAGVRPGRQVETPDVVTAMDRSIVFVLRDHLKAPGIG